MMQTTRTTSVEMKALVTAGTDVRARTTDELNLTPIEAARRWKRDDLLV